MLRKVILLAVLLTVIFAISVTSNREFNTSLTSTPAESRVPTTNPTDANKSTSSDTEPKRITEDETSVIIFTGEGTPTNSSENNVKLDDAERIYADFLKLEKVIRRYLSGGHRISMLNFQTLKELGYLSTEDLYLEKHYEIGFVPTGDGFTIFVRPKDSLNEETISALRNKENIKSDVHGKLQYEFWIKAYRTP